MLNSFYFLRREVSNDDEMTSSKFLKKTHIMYNVTITTSRGGFG
ncbi:hypothetical protein HMPREF1236_0268 [Streptococcus pyogenes GA40056]|nr:hypothetical protein HMPREF1236_0268 [Streptococcus pyogenes GA40056]